MELKYANSKAEIEGFTGSNRTFMELKFTETVQAANDGAF